MFEYVNEPLNTFVIRAPCRIELYGAQIMIDFSRVQGWMVEVLMCVNLGMVDGCDLAWRAYFTTHRLEA